MRIPKLLIASILVLAVAASGCAGAKDPSGSDGSLGEVKDIKATSTTGGVHGFVVDQKIVPVKGALVSVTPTGKNTTTDAGGAFVIDGLPAGTYLVKASHGLYDTQQQTVEVVAGVEDPPDIKFQLTRLISSNPYVQTLKFDGYIVCSLNSPVVLSEECGEGVGVPCVAPPAPCGRVGGQDNNNIQWDIMVDAGAASMVFEQVWEATSDAGGELYTPIGIHWICDPNCAWDSVTEMQGPSPLYAQIGPKEIAASKIGPGTNVTMFTWAGSFNSPAGVALNQRFTDFASIAYYLPLPDGWSFVKGDLPPF